MISAKISNLGTYNLLMVGAIFFKEWLIFFQKSKVFLSNLENPLHVSEEYYCQTLSVWRSPFLFFTKSMYAKKDYELTPFLAYEIVRMAERGITYINHKRYVVSEPNCRPQNEKGRPLGMWILD